MDRLPYTAYRVADSLIAGVSGADGGGADGAEVQAPGISSTADRRRPVTPLAAGSAETTCGTEEACENA